MRGRKPKATVLAELHGKPNHRRKNNPTEPKPSARLTDPPDFLSAGAREGWIYYLANSPPSMLKAIDRGLLAAYVIAEDLHRQATMAQAKCELIVNVGKDKDHPALQQSPYLPIINRQALIMAKMASELGFSPTARPRISAGEPAPTLELPDVEEDARATPRKSLDDFLATRPGIEKIH